MAAIDKIEGLARSEDHGADLTDWFQPIGELLEGRRLELLEGKKIQPEDEFFFRVVRKENFEFGIWANVLESLDENQNVCSSIFLYDFHVPDEQQANDPGHSCIGRQNRLPNIRLFMLRHIEALTGNNAKLVTEKHGIRKGVIDTLRAIGSGPPAEIHRHLLMNGKKFNLGSIQNELREMLVENQIKQDGQKQPYYLPKRLKNP